MIQCCHQKYDPEFACLKPARWKGNPRVVNPPGDELTWCDEHKCDHDLPLEGAAE